MAGWRGPKVGSSIPLSRHGSGGIFGANLSPTLADPMQSGETGEKPISNTATLPVRQNVVVPAMVRPGRVLGTDHGVPGTQVNRAYGNPQVATRASNSRDASWGSNKTEPAPGGVDGSVGDPTAGGESGINQNQPWPHVSALNVGQESSWRGGLFFANDRLEAYDRHAILDPGTERGGGRGSGQTDPPMDGPARPNLRLVNRVINWQVGNPLAHQDQEPGENRQYHMVQGEKPFGSSAQVGAYYANKNRVFEPGPQYVGEQGIGWSPVYGGVPGMYQPYGSYAGYAPDGPQGIQSPAPPGTQADGPQLVFGGLPHGLHSQTYPDYSSTLGRYLAIPQMSPPRLDRPSNSPIAGQAYNQYVQPQGQVGTVAAIPQTMQAQQATSQQWRGNLSGTGWRGIRPGGGQT